MATLTTGPYALSKYQNSWRVSGSWNGERVRKNFADVVEAQVFCDKKNAEALAMGPQLNVAHTRLTGAELVSAEAAFSRIAGRWPLGLVVDAGIEVLAKGHSCVPIADLAEDFIKLVEKEIKTRWAGDLRARIRYFVNDHKGLTVDKLDAAVVRKWLDGLTVGPTTKRNYRGVLHRWGGWLKEGGHVAVNPFSDIRILNTKQDRGELPTILHPLQAEAFMLAVQTERCRPILGWAALCLFGGLRPDNEAPVRVWSDIDFATGEVHVMGRKRGGKLRIFKATPQLLAWMKFVQRDKAETPAYFSRRLRRAAVAWANGWLAGKGGKPIEWDEDILRHSYASYRAGQGVAVTDLAAEMGTSADMIYAHYRHPRAAAEVKAFTEILPPAE